MLLDTYAWIEFFNGTDKGKLVGNIIAENPCFTSAVSLAELSAWVEEDGAPRQVVFNAVNRLSSVLGLTQETLEISGIVKHMKMKGQKNFGLVDAIILAQAKQYNLKIVTGDSHFESENAIML